MVPAAPAAAAAAAAPPATAAFPSVSSIKSRLIRLSTPFPSSSPSFISISVSYFRPHLSALFLPFPRRCPRILAVAEGEEKTVATSVEEEKAEENVRAAVDGEAAPAEFKLKTWPCELYICNLTRNCDVSQLLELFKPHGTICSVEVSRDVNSGLSRGCGYVTMSSLQEARQAISALDKSDLGGRELRVKFSADMGSGRKNTQALNTAPKKNVIFESPYKAYVGNLAWSARPEDLREYFSKFGTVTSTRLLYDRKGGRNRVYGFVSFSSANELKTALGANGSVFHGRTLLVKEVIHREDL